MLFLGFVSEISHCLVKSIREAAEDPFFTIAEPGLSVSKLAKQLTSVLNSEDQVFQDFAKKISDTFFDYLNTELYKREEREKLFNKLINTCFNEEMIRRWEAVPLHYQCPFGMQAMKMLLNFVLDRSIKESLSYFKEKEKAHFIDVRRLKITRSEEQTIRYVAGYLCYSLQKKIKHVHTPEGKAVTALLSRWGTDSNDDLKKNATLSDYTQAWVDVVNRGGVFKVSDQFFNFVLQIERVARTVINCNLLCQRGTDIKKTLIAKFEGNPFVSEKWDELTSDVENRELVEKIKTGILETWANTRLYAFIAAVMQIYKKKVLHKRGTVLERAEPALRKTLASKKRKAVEILTAKTKKNK